MGGKACSFAARYQPALAKAILKGLQKTLDRKDPQRLQALMRAVTARIRGAGVRAPVEQTTLLRSPKKGDKAREAYYIVNEGTEIPQDGIEFDVDPTFLGKND